MLVNWRQWTEFTEILSLSYLSYTLPKKIILYNFHCIYIFCIEISVMLCYSYIFAIWFAYWVQCYDCMVSPNTSLPFFFMAARGKKNATAHESLQKFVFSFAFVVATPCSLLFVLPLCDYYAVCVFLVYVFASLQQIKFFFSMLLLLPLF